MRGRATTWDVASMASHVLLSTAEPEAACTAYATAGGVHVGLGALFCGGGGPLEEMLLRRVLSFLDLHDIATIGPTVSRAWQRCVTEHCYPQLTAPGREVEVWASVLTEAHESGNADQAAGARLRAYVVTPPVGSTGAFPVSPAPTEAATKTTDRAEQELFVKLLDCGVTKGNSGAPNALSSVQCVRAGAVRPISRICRATVESWLRQEAMEGSKPLAMHAATTLAAFLPFCCQRCGASAVQQQEQEDEVVDHNGATAGRLVDVFTAKCRFGARQLRPGVRENLSWMTLEDRRKRLQCLSCLVLEAGEVGRLSRYSGIASGSDASVVQDATRNTTLSSTEEERPSPWLHIDFHTGGRADSTTRADAGGPRKQQVQQALTTREEVSEWLEAHYMGADEFCAALSENRNRGQLRAVSLDGVN